MTNNLPTTSRATGSAPRLNPAGLPADARRDEGTVAGTPVRPPLDVPAVPLFTAVVSHAENHWPLAAQPPVRWSCRGTAHSCTARCSPAPDFSVFVGADPESLRAMQHRVHVLLLAAEHVGDDDARQ